MATRKQTAYRPLPVFAAQERKRSALARSGLCGPCARAIATAGFTGQPRLCPDCEGIAADGETN